MHQISFLRISQWSLVWLISIGMFAGTCTHSSAQDEQVIVEELTRLIQLEQDPFGGPAVPVPVQEEKQDKKKQDDKKDEKEEDQDTNSVKRVEVKPANPREVRFHLWDGNIFTGNLAGEGLTVETEFGNLSIPVEKLYGFRPGLDSFPELSGQLKGLVERLGDKDFNTREKAHKDIVNLGPKFLMQIYEFEDGGNAERKRHLKEIREELEELAEDAEADDETEDTDNMTMIRGDSVQTKDFTIVGKISQKSFVVETKHGNLTVQLADIKYMDRTMTGGGDVRKTVRVMGSNMLGKSMKSTGIRVEKGDTISIRANGQITMTPWGSNRASGPDGSPNYSKNGSFNGGALVVQVGDGKAVFAGKKKTIKANASGVLKLGVAIPTSYMNYAFPGEYKVSTRVTTGGGK